MEKLFANFDGQIAVVAIAYGVVCWLVGWHASIKASGRMYDEGYRAGYTARGASPLDKKEVPK